MKIYEFNGFSNISGDRIHQARTTLRMSQSTLATKLQLKGVTINRESISRIETGARFVTDYELKALSEILNVSMDWLTNKDSD